jgi:hypothetical protein
MPHSEWAALHAVTVPTLLAYAVLFAIAIGVVNFIRSIVLR